MQQQQFLGPPPVQLLWQPVPRLTDGAELGVLHLGAASPTAPGNTQAACQTNSRHPG